MAQLIMELTSISPNELLMGSIYLRLYEWDGVEEVGGCEKDGKRKKQGRCRLRYLENNKDSHTQISLLYLLYVYFWIGSY